MCDSGEFMRVMFFEGEFALFTLCDKNPDLISLFQVLTLGNQCEALVNDANQLFYHPFEERFRGSYKLNAFCSSCGVLWNENYTDGFYFVEPYAINVSFKTSKPTRPKKSNPNTIHGSKFDDLLTDLKGWNLNPRHFSLEVLFIILFLFFNNRHNIIVIFWLVIIYLKLAQKQAACIAKSLGTLRHNYWCFILIEHLMTLVLS